MCVSLLWRMCTCFQGRPMQHNSSVTGENSLTSLSFSVWSLLIPLSTVMIAWVDTQTVWTCLLCSGHSTNGSYMTKISAGLRPPVKPSLYSSWGIWILFGVGSFRESEPRALVWLVLVFNFQDPFNFFPFHSQEQRYPAELSGNES